MRISDWSSDVCSSDLYCQDPTDWQGVVIRWDEKSEFYQNSSFPNRMIDSVFTRQANRAQTVYGRSEERREGKSVSVRVDRGGRRIIKKKNKRESVKNIEINTTKREQCRSDDKY